MRKECSRVAVRIAMTVHILKTTPIDKEKIDSSRVSLSSRNPLTCMSFYLPPSCSFNFCTLPSLTRTYRYLALLLPKSTTAWSASFRGRACVYGTTSFSAVNSSVSFFYCFYINNIKSNPPSQLHQSFRSR